MSRKQSDSLASIDRRLSPEIEGLISRSGLPADLQEALRRVGLSRGPQTRVVEAVKELIDHFHTGLERGATSEDLLTQVGPGDLIAQAMERDPDYMAETPTSPTTSAGQVIASETMAALRSLLRNPVFAFANVATLSLGIAAAVTLFALFHGVVLAPLPYEEPEELHELREISKDGNRFFASYPNFNDVRELNDVFDYVLSTTWGGNVTILGLERPVQARMLGVSRDFFSALGVGMIHGRVLDNRQNRPGGASEVVVGEEFWRSQLGAEPDLSKLTLQVGTRQHQVVGVVPAGFQLLQSAELYGGHELFPGTHRGAHAYQVVVRLADGVTPQQAEDRLENLYASLTELYPEDMEAATAVLEPLKDQVVGSFRTVAAVLFGAALLVVLLASLDVGASLVARARHRAGEIALRRSLGATRGRLVIRQGLEALVLAVPASLLGVLLSRWIIAWLGSIEGSEIPRLGEVSIDPVVVAFAAGVSCLSVLACGVLPLGQTLKISPASLIREAGSGRRRKRFGWTSLVAGEVAVAFLMLVGALLLIRSLDQVFSEDIGFKSAGVTAAYLQLPSSKYTDPEQAIRFKQELDRKLASTGQVQRTALANYLPFDWGSWTAPVKDRIDPDSRVAFTAYRLVSPDYFDVLEIPLLAGSLLPEDGLVDGVTATVVNRALAQKLAAGAPIESVVGKEILNNMDPRSEWMRVVGVVEEARHWRAEPGQQAEQFIHFEQRLESLFTQVILFETEGSPLAGHRAFEEALRSVDPDVPARLVPLSEEMARTVSRERLATTVLVAFAAVMLVLTLAGIVGVVSRSVAERQREAGIRIALGATPGKVVTLLQTEVLVPVALGLVVGVATALVASKSLNSLLYGVSATDGLAFGMTGLALLAAAFLASLIPARRVLSENVAETIRSD